MKYDERSLPAILDRSFARFRILPHQEVQGACDRVLSRLRNEVERDPAAVVPIRLVAPSRLRWRRLAIAAATAVVILAVLSVRPRTGPDATVEIAEGQAYKTVADSGAMLSCPITRVWKYGLNPILLSNAPMTAFEFNSAKVASS